MGLEGLKLTVGSDLTLDRDALTIVRKFSVKGTLTGLGSDVFDTVASYVMSAIQAGGIDANGHAYGPTYDTPMGTLFWNSIQLHENYYAQYYEASVTYSPFDKQTGTYLIRVEHGAGMVRATAGELIEVYPTTLKLDNESGVIEDGDEVVGADVPYNQTRIVVSYRHPQAFLNHAYIRDVGKLVGHPNNDEFLGYEPGEIAYMGGNMTESECEASAEYTFEVSPNETNIEVGGITIAEKKGFDVICPIYKQVVGEDEAGSRKKLREVDRIRIIRPPERDWKDYVDVFKWGGSE